VKCKGKGEHKLLEGKVIVVTGGAAGIGRGICEALTANGARVAVVQRSVEAAERAAASHRGARGFCADISDHAQVERMVDAVVDSFGQVDGLVNNASVTGPNALASFPSMTPEQVHRIVDSNLKGTIWCSQAVARHLIGRSAPGAIVHISSVAAFAAQELASVYCATKAAQVSLAQSMALELAPYNIRVNAVAPGDIRTETSAEIAEEVRSRGAQGKYLRVTPLGRRGLPSEIGDAVVFLLSEKASFITGTTLTVDGGLLAS
jgi:NAD(P)-dependent dehydrogenase (short-subunit alcohol dehydrogenase family)